MSRTTQLFELQQVDSQSDELLRRALSINQTLGETGTLATVRAQHATITAALAASQVQLRALSHEVDDLSAHLTTQNTRLYDGSVKNAKELAAIQHEVGHTKEVRAAREDRLLELMELVDAQQAAVDEATRALGVAETEWQRHQEGLLEEKDAVDERLRALRTRRAKLAADIPAVDLQLYERLRKAKHGVAVTAMVNDICQACRVTISARASLTAKLGQELVYCPSCARVLHPGARGDLVGR